jgi:hypothetical protein
MSTLSAAAATALLRDLPDDQDPVLAGRRLRPGVALAETSRFGEDVWRLEPAVLQQHVRSMMLNFHLVPDRYRLHAKQLCYAMLAGPLPAGEKRQTPVGIRGTLRDLRRFLTWLDTRLAAPGRVARPALAELTAQDLADYHRHLLDIGNAGTRENARRAVRLLWRYRHGLTDPLPFDPRDLEDWASHRAQRSRENSTDRISEPVLGPLIGWALRFVDEFAIDILAAEDALRDYQSRFTNGRRGRNSGFREDLQSYLDSYIREARPLPGYQGRPNLQFIAVDAGTNATRFGQPVLREMVLAAAAKVGVTDYTWLPLRLRGRLDREPWIDGIALQHPSRSVRKLARMLQVACYVVIAFLSGMRDAEIKHLRRGCLRVQRDPDGRPYRWMLTGLAFKGEPNPAGTPATWVVGHPAARAVEVLERLQPPGQPLLFGHLPHSPGGIEASPTRALTTKATNAQLAEFAAWINDYCAGQHRGDTIPLGALRLSTRQFRRTLAWFIARQPGGSIAGAIQYRHLSVQMFEGYAGTSDSGFRAEVESEQALARGDRLLAMIDAHEHTRLAGPAAAEAERRLAEFDEQARLDEQARFAGTVLTDPRRLTRLMRRQDPAIYPGTFATCVFQPDKALCQQHRDLRGATRPGLGECRPLECGNVALTTDNFTALRAELDHIADELAARPSLPPLLAHRLRGRYEQIARFLDRHTPETR